MVVGKRWQGGQGPSLNFEIWYFAVNLLVEKCFSPSFGVGNVKFHHSCAHWKKFFRRSWLRCYERRAHWPQREAKRKTTPVENWTPTVNFFRFRTRRCFYFIGLGIIFVSVLLRCDEPRSTSYTATRFFLFYCRIRSLRTPVVLVLQRRHLRSNYRPATRLPLPMRRRLDGR